MAADNFGSTAAMGIAAAATLGAAGYFWMTSDSAVKLNAFVDLNKQTRVLPDGSRVAACLKDDNLIPYAFDDAKTVSAALRRGLRESRDGHMLGVRKKQPDGSAPYTWVTYKQVIERSENLARGFEQIGLVRGQDTFIGIFARNRPEVCFLPSWIICEHATYNNRSVLVPIYETLGREACTFIVNQTQLRIIVVDDEHKAKKPPALSSQMK
ncbi:unnamed protein product [Gongylonema pulchrum]|uniref:long-chain-fatty-acid--CoA ligase n=1 Tax=Gongylonema pulchrum TaxID=637853 RepID=A0A183DZJ3_9BILA|nr:unnamed protein product [Gongylonema pulchrum]